MDDKEVTEALLPQNNENADQAPDTKPIHETTGLKRQIGLFGMISFLIGSIIGAGIFAAPRSVATYAGSAGGMLLIWVIAGSFAMIGALVFCELALTFPNNCAGHYTYIYEAFGEFPAFMTLYSAVLIDPAALALVCIVVGDYLMTAIAGEGDSLYSKIVAGAVIVINMALNCFSVKWVERIQIFFTIAKMIPIAMLIVTGIVRLAQGHTENFKNAFNGTSTSVSDFAFGLYGGMFAYGGWEIVNFVAAEAANPVRDIPIAVSVAMPIIIACYTLVNIAYLSVHSVQEIGQSGAIAVAIGQQLYGEMHWTIPLLVACSVFGAANNFSYKISRTYYEAAIRKQLPALLGYAHRTRHTPIPAVVIHSLISLIVLLPNSTNFRSLLNFVLFIAWLNLALCIAALLWLRKSRPDMKRPFRMFIIVPIMFFVFTLFLVAAPFVKYPVNQLYGICVLLPAVPIYFGFVKYQILPDRFLKAIDDVTRKIQEVGNLETPDKPTSAEL